MQGSSEVGEMRLEIKHAKLQEISVDYFKMKELIAVSLPVWHIRARAYLRNKNWKHLGLQDQGQLDLNQSGQEGWSKDPPAPGR